MYRATPKTVRLEGELKNYYMSIGGTQESDWYWLLETSFEEDGKVFLTSHLLANESNLITDISEYGNFNDSDKVVVIGTEDMMQAGMAIWKVIKVEKIENP